MSRNEGTDPDGAGINEQKVNKEGQALVFSTTQSELEHESEENGSGYTWASDIVNAAATGDTTLLVKNTSDTHLHIDSIFISCGSVSSEFTIHLPTTEVTVTAGSGGAVVTGVNINTTSSNVADASAASNESNNSQGNVIGTVFLAIDRSQVFLTPGLILGKNKSLGVDTVEDTTEAAITITGHYED